MSWGDHWRRLKGWLLRRLDRLKLFIWSPSFSILIALASVVTSAGALFVAYKTMALTFDQHQELSVYYEDGLQGSAAKGLFDILFVFINSGKRPAALVSINMTEIVGPMVGTAVCGDPVTATYALANPGHPISNEGSILTTAGPTNILIKSAAASQLQSILPAGSITTVSAKYHLPSISDREQKPTVLCAAIHYIDGLGRTHMAMCPYATWRARHGIVFSMPGLLTDRGEMKAASLLPLGSANVCKIFQMSG